jgi:hypothetical protein
VAVRKVEAASPTLWPPAALFVLLGAGLEVLALRSASLELSAALGILGVTLLWDALELRRQQRRVQKGHAPANPRNPRHARLLATCPAATTIDLLERSPTGRPLSAAEIDQILKGEG